jgi:hypothetical protein
VSAIGLQAFTTCDSGLALELGGAQPELITPVLGMVQRVLERHLQEAAGIFGGQGQGGSVTLIQRFGSAANLNMSRLSLGSPYKRSRGHARCS